MKNPEEDYKIKRNLKIIVNPEFYSNGSIKNFDLKHLINTKKDLEDFKKDLRSLHG